MAIGSKTGATPGQDLGNFASSRVIDACVYPLPDGGYRLWYKDEGHESQTWAVDSPDLFTWGEPFMVIQTPDGEGPNVFRLGGRYWLIIDESSKFKSYSSKRFKLLKPLVKLDVVSCWLPAMVAENFKSEVNLISTPARKFHLL